MMRDRGPFTSLHKWPVGLALSPVGPLPHVLGAPSGSAFVGPARAGGRGPRASGLGLAYRPQGPPAISA